ncbi:MAG TPA: 7-cyano-7-deazaguanine synthase [Streptosporangiaceae bacterium]|nr:7-cyano-7-deazaguanine synthase [Streptosporangiaceae bacterium]
MSEILLFSAGLDSFPAWHYLGHPRCLYFDIRHRYREQELAAITALSRRCGIEIEISTELDLSAWEASDAIIPMRNVYFAMLAANRATTIWCTGVKGDATADKSPAAFADISGFISRYIGTTIRVDSPFWQMTKTEIVAWYLEAGLSPQDLLLTFSCSRADGHGDHCGRCSSCLRRWISLVNNGIDAPFEVEPWTWQKVAGFYMTAMTDGSYPESRAVEFWRAMASVGITPPAPVPDL